MEPSGGGGGGGEPCAPQGDDPHTPRRRVGGRAPSSSLSLWHSSFISTPRAGARAGCGGPNSPPCRRQWASSASICCRLMHARTHALARWRRTYRATLCRTDKRTSVVWGCPFCRSTQSHSHSKLLLGHLVAVHPTTVKLGACASGAQGLAQMVSGIALRSKSRPIYPLPSPSPSVHGTEASKDAYKMHCPRESGVSCVSCSSTG